jgi:hypothetical protein
VGKCCAITHPCALPSSITSVAAVVENAVATFLLKSRSDLKRSAVLLWLSANFIWYHLGSYLLGIQYCLALGKYPIACRSHAAANIVVQVLALYWVVGRLSARPGLGNLADESESILRLMRTFQAVWPGQPNPPQRGFGPMTLF